MNNLPIMRALVRAHLRGALLLLRLDTRGFEYMDSSLSGARFSFIAALLSVPLYGLMLIDSSLPETVDTSRFVAIYGLSYVVQWAAMPLLLYYACQIMQRRADWPRLVTPYNWLALWQIVIYVLLAWLLGPLPDAATTPVMLGIGFYLMGVQGWVYTRVLKTGPWIPLLLVALNVVLDWQLGLARYTLLNAPQ